jgi:ADP-heptose:LPS heptosyltransferase
VTLEPRLAVTDADRAEAAAVLAGDDRPLVVLHPGANDPRRRWSVERLAAAGSELARKWARLAVVGTAAEQPLAGLLLDGLDSDAADLAGRLGLGGLAGLHEQATLLVGNDSGPRHLAAAVGTATVAVHWGVSLGSYGPLYRPGTGHLPITRRMLGVDPDGSRTIWTAHVGCLVGPDGSRRVPSDRLEINRMIIGHGQIAG